MDDWLPERDDELREWRRQGFSYELIARKFTALGHKCSKGSVIGRAMRMGLIGVLKKKPRYYLDNHAKFKNLIPSGAALFDKIKATRPAAARPTNSDVAAGEFLGLDLLDLDFGQCRYPQGDGPVLFCGQPARNGSPYCDRHHKLCHTRSWS